MLTPTLSPALLPLLERGIRCFRLPSGDRVLTLPGRGGQVVLVPRGHGTPVVAVESGGQFKSAATGAACSAVRWDCAGRVAGWVREVSTPAPGAVVEAVSLESGGALFVQVQRLVLTVAGVGEASPAVVATNGRVRAANARALARGVIPGSRVDGRVESLGRVVAGGGEAARMALLGDWLCGEYGAAVRVRGGFLLGGSGGLGPLAALRTRIWQATGLTVKLVAGPDAAAVQRLGRALPPNHIAMVPGTVARMWAEAGKSAQLKRSAAGGAWRGEPMVDVEGVVTLAQALLQSVRGLVDLQLRTERGVLHATVDVAATAGRSEAASRVEMAVRRALGCGAAVWSVEWCARAEVAAPRQVALWA